MTKLRILIRRFWGLFFKQRRDRDLQDEIQAHLEMQIDDNIRQGMNTKEARQAALRKFGGVDQVKETYRARLGLPFVETTLNDIRYAFRMLGQKPSFTILATIALALGIGTNTAIFSVVNSVLLRPFPYSQPERLVAVWSASPGNQRQIPLSPARFLDLRAKNQVFDDIAAYEDSYISKRANFFLSGTNEPEQIWGVCASANLFSVLKARPEIGRTFSESDRDNRVAVISDGLWRRRFGADPGIIGKIITLTGQNYSVIGVMPPEFKLVYPKAAEIWVPIVFNEKDRANRGDIVFWSIGRLKPGITLAQARIGLSAVGRQLAQEFPKSDSDIAFDLMPLDEYVVGKTRPVFLILVAAVVLVLLIACVNVSGLLLARATDRAKEVALRTALGASRGRLIRQLLTESLALSLLGGLGGLLFAAWSLRAFSGLIPATVPRGNEGRIDSDVFAFALTISIITGIVFGLVPALYATKFNLSEILKDGNANATAGMGTHRLRSLLMISQVALTLILLVGAGLLINSTWRLSRVPLGFNPDNVLVTQLKLPAFRYRKPEQWAEFNGQLLERVSKLPGVTHAGTSTSVLLHGFDYTFVFKLADSSSPDERHTAAVRMVAGDFFAAMGTPIVRGRAFSESDSSRAPKVAIVNDSFARQFFHDENPIGKKINLDPDVMIVGVVADVRNKSLAQPAAPAFYLPQAQFPMDRICLIVRTAADPLAFAESVKEKIREIDKDQPIEFVGTMSGVVAEAGAETHFYMLMLGAFACVALALTVIGVYGMTSYMVSQRTREIGIRMALGASPINILKTIVMRGVLLAIVGIAIGLGGSFGLARLMIGLLFGITAKDPTTFVAVSLLLTLITFIASYVPARRATRIDPMTALRCE